MYQGDSFFTLTGGQQAGLVILSTGLMALTVITSRQLGRGTIIYRLGAALLVFYLFVWVSPQVYYQYYRLIIDGLPAQWVIGAPPGLPRIARLLLFQDTPNLSNHAQGLLGWGLLLLALLRRKAVRRDE